MSWKIPMYKISWDQEDLDAITNAVRNGMYWATGPDIKKFEQLIADYIGTKHALTFNSGTSALHALLMAYGISKDDEVIVPSFTFISTVNTSLFVGAHPVFADIEEETFGLDPVDVEKKITKKTKAIIAVHYGGMPCKIQKLREIADKHGLILIEDAAEAFGSKIDNKKIGTFGHSAMISFCANKIITTGEGGAIVTDDEKIIEKLKLLRSHGREDKFVKNYFTSEKPADYIDLGFNFRISNITACLGISQIKKTDQNIEMRRKNAEYMNQKLSQIPNINLIKLPNRSFSVYQLYTVRFKNQQIRDKVGKALNENKVMTKVYFDPVHLTSFYKNQGHKKGELPVTEQVAKTVLTLPMYPSITTQDMDYIIKIIGDTNE